MFFWAALFGFLVFVAVAAIVAVIMWVTYSDSRLSRVVRLGIAGAVLVYFLWLIGLRIAENVFQR